MERQSRRPSTKLPHIYQRKFVEPVYAMKIFIRSPLKLSRNAMICSSIFTSSSYLYWCLSLLNLFPSRLDDFVHTTRQLRAFEMAQETPLSLYDCVNVSGPPGNRIFTMTCMHGDHITCGKLMQTCYDIPKEIMNHFFVSQESENPSKLAKTSQLLTC